METIADVLHHLVRFTGALSQTNREEAHRVVDEFLADHFPGLAPHQPTEAELAEAAEAERLAKIEALKAELAGLEGESAPATPAG